MKHDPTIAAIIIAQSVRAAYDIELEHINFYPCEVRVGKKSITVRFRRAFCRTSLDDRGTFEQIYFETDSQSVATIAADMIRAWALMLNP